LIDEIAFKEEERWPHDTPEMPAISRSYAQDEPPSITRYGAYAVAHISIFDAAIYFTAPKNE